MNATPPAQPAPEPPPPTGRADAPVTGAAIALWPAGIPAAAIDAKGGDDPRAREIPALTPYLIDDRATRPLVIVCPGGGYGRRAAHEGEPMARHLNGLGLHAAVLDYRVWPWRYPAALRDARRALRLVRHHAAAWRTDATRVGILGFSAGGHLAASASVLHDACLDEAGDDLAALSARPDFSILCYAVLSFGPCRHHGSMVSLLGDPPPPAAQDFLSLEHRVGPTTPRTFLWSTADDQAVPVANTLAYAAALARHRVPFAAHIYPHGRHGAGLADAHPYIKPWQAALADWLSEEGLRPA